MNKNDFKNQYAITCTFAVYSQSLFYFFLLKNMFMCDVDFIFTQYSTFFFTRNRAKIPRKCKSFTVILELMSPLEMPLMT